MTTQCCYCVPLKAGVVMTSLIWLIYGIFIVVSSALYLNSPAKNDDTELERRNIDAYNTYIISIIILYGLMILGAAFGLFVVTFANTFKMLLIYSKIAYGILAIEIITSIIGFIAIILFASPILLTYLVIGAVFSITISVHFAMVISAYANRRGKKEAAVNKHDKQSNDIL